ncbi:hypothetical protein RJ639_018031 [Escallonia herrerae]|uniref:RIN4 pathogenic type III effector avirulence factor Avr cleavage site domain-containing protein n=1 Tax=Escallonia herrerae TaxID=1293975 RepID=A0AA88V8J9_9ASTE|nr:hypothetical protein RJ639_018031 [Escallonia herrerae]
MGKKNRLCVYGNFSCGICNIKRSCQERVVTQGWKVEIRISHLRFMLICGAFCLTRSFYLFVMEKGQPLPKFGEWDVNDPASADGFTVIFNKARDERKTGGKPESPGKADNNFKHGVDAVKPQAVSCSLNPYLTRYEAADFNGSCY